MQCGLGIGFFLASFVWLYVSGYGPHAWRFMFLIGVIPAAFTLWLRTGIPESEKWNTTNEKRKSAQSRKKSGGTLSDEDHELTRFTFADLFANPEIRRRTIIVFLMSLTTTLAWWGISTWVPPFIAGIAGKAGLPAANLGELCRHELQHRRHLGYIGLGFLADNFGRKPIVMIFFAASLVLTPVLYMVDDRPALVAAGGGDQRLLHARPIFVDVGLAAGAVPDAHARDGMAFVFNSPRFIAFLGPMFAGMLIAKLGGFSQVAVAFSLIYILGFVATCRSCLKPKASRCRRKKEWPDKHSAVQCQRRCTAFSYRNSGSEPCCKRSSRSIRPAWRSPAAITATR